MIEYLKEWVDLSPFIHTPATEGVRYNPKKISREAFLEQVPFDVRPNPLYEKGYIVDGGETNGNHPYHQAGLYYFQEPSAMSAVTALQLKPSDRVLDLCAAPGSKSTAIAAELTDGLLVANEINAKRASALLSNLERMGISRAVITHTDGEHLAKAAPQYFDKVLIDSPCSGEGMFRKYPRILEEWTPELVELCTQRSRGVLEAGAQTLKPGGRLVYSTCTFNPEENEKTILWFLERHPEFRVVETGIQGGAPGFFGLDQARRIFPGPDGEGHFVCAMVHTGEGERKNLPTLKGEKLPEEMAFLKSVVKDPKGNLIRRGNFCYLVDEDLPELKGLLVLRAGIQALEQVGRQWKPAHHLAMCFPKERFSFYEECDLQLANAYLRGEVIPSRGKGFGVATVAGTPMGWIKSSNGQGKNHYPKGLRLLK